MKVDRKIGSGHDKLSIGQPNELDGPVLIGRLSKDEKLIEINTNGGHSIAIENIYFWSSK